MNDRDESLTMTYSGIMKKNREKVVYVRFERKQGGQTEFAEGVLPNCKIEKSFGFTQEEIAGLELYLHGQVQDIFELAQKINDGEFWLH